VVIPPLRYDIFASRKIYHGRRDDQQIDDEDDIIVLEDGAALGAVEECCRFNRPPPRLAETSL
jgi:hypothetical protein